MSEWERNDGQRGGESTIRGYENGVLIGSTGRGAGAVLFTWSVHDETRLWDPCLDGQAPTEADAQAACDAAAVAWVLIALAKRAAAWATEVDAGLARSYRAAVAEHRVARRAWARALEADRAALEPEYQRTARAGFVALDALERGCP